MRKLLKSIFLYGALSVALFSVSFATSMNIFSIAYAEEEDEAVPYSYLEVYNGDQIAAMYKEQHDETCQNNVTDLLKMLATNNFNMNYITITNFRTGLEDIQGEAQATVLLQAVDNYGVIEGYSKIFTVNMDSVPNLYKFKSECFGQKEEILYGNTPYGAKDFDSLVLKKPRKYQPMVFFKGRYEKMTFPSYHGPFRTERAYLRGLLYTLLKMNPGFAQYQISNENGIGQGPAAYDVYIGNKTVVLDGMEFQKYSFKNSYNVYFIDYYLRNNRLCFINQRMAHPTERLYDRNEWHLFYYYNYGE